MKKVIAIFLTFSIVFCLCSCNSKPDNFSSEAIVVEYEEIVIDETGGREDTVTEIQPQPDLNNNVSSEQTSGNSSSAASVVSVIKIDYDTVVEVDLCDDVVRGYLDAKDAKNQFFWLNSYSGTGYDHQTLSLDWFRDGSTSYKVYFSESRDFSNPIIIETVYSDIENTTLIPGKTYYWKVTGTITSDVLGGGVIKTKDAPVRWISIDGVGNVRDMGGWKAEGGKTVKYGMLYRGRRLEDVTQTGIETIKSLGLKTELDIRYENQKYQTPGTGMSYQFIESPGQYDNVLNSNGDVFKKSYKQLFKLLSDESNYPFYAHCNAGADRTGTFAFIVNGVLGVSYEDLTRDFELTSFSSGSKRWRADADYDTDGQMNWLDLEKTKTDGNYVAWGTLYNKMMTYGEENGCDTLQSSIEHWLLNYIGVTQAQIDSFKNIMLG